MFSACTTGEAYWVCSSVSLTCHGHVANWDDWRPFQAGQFYIEVLCPVAVLSEQVLQQVSERVSFPLLEFCWNPWIWLLILSGWSHPLWFRIRRGLACSCFSFDDFCNISLQYWCYWRRDISSINPPTIWARSIMAESTHKIPWSSVGRPASSLLLTGLNVHHISK